MTLLVIDTVFFFIVCHPVGQIKWNDQLTNAIGTGIGVLGGVIGFSSGLVPHAQVRTEFGPV
jgi:hypothetical protein